VADLFVLTFARTAIAFQFQSLAALSSFLIGHFPVELRRAWQPCRALPSSRRAHFPAGRMIANRFGDKPIACIGLAAMTLGGLILAAAEATYLVTIGRVVSGTGAVFQVQSHHGPIQAKIARFNLPLNDKLQTNFRCDYQ
jgi:hypothetical protein